MTRPAFIVTIAVFLLVFPFTTAAQRPSLSADEYAWLEENLHPLDSVSPTASHEDLAFLDAFIGDARIVGLGEATHGNHEFFTLKHRIVRYLAEEHGFTIFAIEANLPETYLINRYVLTGEGDPEALLEGVHYWIWQTHEVLDLIHWMRDFNASGRGTMQFVGFDMYRPWLAAQEVYRFLE